MISGTTSGLHNYDKIKDNIKPQNEQTLFRGAGELTLSHPNLHLIVPLTPEAAH